MSEKILEVRNLRKYFPVEKSFIDRILSRQKKVVHAVDKISFDVKKEEIFGIVGESGCGKTTVAKLILRLIEPDEGEVLFDRVNVLTLSKERMREIRKNMQLIFQDPYASLNPRITIGDIVAENLIVHRIVKDREEKRKKVMEVLEQVGLTPANQFMSRYPHELSGGQRQRVAIARALVLNPKLVIADEPVSSLDASIKAQILNLLTDLKEQFGLTYILIDHNLPLVRYFCDHVTVMYLGKIVEIAETDELFFHPKHPYTKALISAIPKLKPDEVREKINIKGEVPSAINPPKGCRFHTRCPYKMEECEKIEPNLIPIEKEHKVACHLFK